VDPEPRFVAQLLSEESLRRTVLDVSEVTRWRKGFREMRADSLLDSPWNGPHWGRRHQLWHHQFMGGGLADMPEWSASETSFANDVVPSRRASSQLLQDLLSDLFHLRVILFFVRHRHPLLNVLRASSLRPSAHKCGLVDVMHERFG